MCRNWRANMLRGLLSSWHAWALKAKSETARIAAIRELLDRGYGRPRLAMEVSVPADNPLQLLLDEIDARSRIEAPVSHTPD